MDGGGCHQADAGVAVVVVVMVEERREDATRMIHAAETVGEGRRIFSGLEQALAERVIVALVGPRERGIDAQIGQQLGQGLGAHRRAAVGVQGCLQPRSSRERPLAEPRGFRKSLIEMNLKSRKSQSVACP